MDAESRSALPGVLRESLEKEGATLTGAVRCDLAVRSAAAACGLGLIRSLKGREFLRSFEQVERVAERVAGGLVRWLNQPIMVGKNQQQWLTIGEWFIIEDDNQQ
eukprot:Skav208547  [mRNA]  locus=scaffold1216:422081:423249:+ [translate_table: standard]